MPIDRERSRQCLKAFDFRKLFIEELGWDKFSGKLLKQIDGTEYGFHAVAEKRGVVVLASDTIPDYAVRVKLDKLIAKDHFEHLIVFADKAQGRQVWQWVRKESGKPTAVRTYHFSSNTSSGQAGELLLQKLDNLVFTLEEEEAIRTGTVTNRLKAFDVEKVTKKFYERFKTEHASFLGIIKGIPDKQMESWYASVMINRLMFLYFIQEKGFLNGDKDYLRNKLAESTARKSNAYYAEFLSPLFFQGFARKKADRSPATNKLLGEIPYLNGGLFQKHQIEEIHGKTIVIADKAFEKLFDFFKEYNWHLDEREDRNDREINPDVLGYIFEKYINQKQMGAYYTKEDITEYISQNTIIPFLLDEARKGCAIAFAPEGSVWRLLRDDPDRYIHDAMKKGANLALPAEIEAGVDDVAQRAGWNRAAPEEYALPTEIWRESIDRHQRYRRVRAKLAGGEVQEVNDLVTLNLNIRQFAQDVIQFSEGPELLRAIWKAVEKVSVLDPTCGSGAFLFAALNILKPLYDACIQRMEGFVEDLEATGKHDPKKFKDFKDTLLKSREHPKTDYFVLKAIIVNNLFGVDIMEEAVEICKLRLFLKLVAQVESQDRIEPLPDIDFNIRSGNTLVGYTDLEAVKKSVSAKLDFGDAMSRIQDRALQLDSAVDIFRRQQTQLDGTITSADKAELRRRFTELEDELNDYLSGEYGVGKRTIKEWKISHKPFHWFCDFHRIVDEGGFDVVIGNPPYVEINSEHVKYGVVGFQTIDCGDLYALVMERTLHLTKDTSYIGLIVPVSLPSVDGFSSLRRVTASLSKAIWVSHYAERPAKLFEGVEKRLTISISKKGSCETPKFWTTRYNRWVSEERPYLFSTLGYVIRPDEKIHLVGDSWPKVSSDLESKILEKLQEPPLALSMLKTSEFQNYYTRKLRYFIQFFDFVPEIRDDKNRLIEPSELKSLFFRNDDDRAAALAALNSTIFFWFFNVFSDVRNVNRREILCFPLSLAQLDPRSRRALTSLGRVLMADFIENAEVLTATYKKLKKTLHIQSFQPRQSKQVIDQIDAALGAHYSLSEQELDFIINFDIKYRMGIEVREDSE